MRALVVSDIHGNLHALEAVLAAAHATPGSFDQLWNLGDMVGYGANPNEVLDTLRPLATASVRGNHDRVCCGLSSSQGFNPVAAQAAAWTQRHLTPSNLDWLRAVPQGPLTAAERVTIAHGSPLNEDHYIISMRDAWMPLQRMPTDITFFGHTHVQGAFSQQPPEWQEVRPLYHAADQPEHFTLDVPAGTRHLINPGSVGQPRDADWRAAFALYDDAVERVTFFRIPYDVAAAQAAIRAAALPERLASRLSTGR
ncbi:MAG TPA: metallophosphoesterase family protein [Acidobacteriaceae bacterium]|jgi:diadenosine tetraphosphatase ApaH/serine/threonine PP2A family protein phosphatase|nr:metallophosphoesterase family protein [Acidobacteriaceae bacterium]